MHTHTFKISFITEVYMYMLIKNKDTNVSDPTPTFLVRHSLEVKTFLFECVNFSRSICATNAVLICRV